MQCEIELIGSIVGSNESKQDCQAFLQIKKVLYVSVSAGSRNILALPCLVLPSGWAGSYTCPALKPYQFGPMRVPKCNHKVTSNGYKAVDDCEAVNNGCEAASKQL